MRSCFFIIAALLYLSSTSFAQSNGRLSGRINNRSSQMPAENCTVQLIPGTYQTLTDSTGRFRLSQIEPGAYQVLVTGSGFQPYRINNLIVSSGNETNLIIELEPQVVQLNAVTVTGRKNTARAATLETPLSIQRLTTEEIKANPGGNFDISKVIQSLPGVGGGVGGGSFRNDIIIRGGAPSENVFYLDGIEVPVINHFSTQGSGGGPQGILNVSFIEEVKLSTSAFDARYDNALSSVFQFRQKNGNENRLQGNIRLSGTELAATFDGPLSKKTSFLASARRSYLEFLFKAIDLPIRPNYWDFQFKTSTRFNKKTTLSVLGLGAIDEFSFAFPKKATPEKLYVLNSNPIINQWNYTIGASLKRSTPNGYWQLSVSRNNLNNETRKYLDNQHPTDTTQTQMIQSRETENKVRLEVTGNYGSWKIAYGGMLQYVQFDNFYYEIRRPRLSDAQGNTLQEPDIISSYSNLPFWRYGGFFQAGTRLFDNRLAVNAGFRVDGNSFENSEANVLKQFSPRISLRYALHPKWNLSLGAGTYFKLPSYTQLTYRSVLSSSSAYPNPGRYIESRHLAGGAEWLPTNYTRITLEGFYKKYRNYPVSRNDGISLANKGTEFGAIGNEPVLQNGTGNAWGIELLLQQKLTKQFFGILSYTWYRSEFSNAAGQLVPASWDNHHLLSITAGYKMKKNWEIGLKFRYQGAAPYTPFDLDASRLNYLTLGTGVLDYRRANSLRLPAFHAADLRIDKKWNFRKTTLDLYLDIQNMYGSKSAGTPQYTFQRTEDNTAFSTTDGQPVNRNGSNARPLILNNADGNVLPTIGCIVEF